MTAVVEIGTHSVKCLRDGRDAVTITRLGEGLARTGRIAPAAAARTLRAIRRYLRDGPARIVATHALRVAKNRDEVLGRWGLDVRVLTERKEARYSYLGATSGLPSGRYAIIDIGGGSTEVATESNGFSIPHGAATLTQQHVQGDPWDWGDFHRITEACKAAVSRIPWKRIGDRQMVGVGGTATTLAVLDTGMAESLPPFEHVQRGLVTLRRMGIVKRPDVSRVEGCRVKLVNVLGWFMWLTSNTIAERCAVPGLDRGRADILPAGLFLLYACMRVARQESILVSTRGVRHGVALTCRP